jgi:hypothetical protein
MNELISTADPITAAWLTGILQTQGYLDQGHVTAIQTHPLDAPGVSTKLCLDIQYSAEAPASAPARLFLKLSQPYMADILPSAGRKEVQFYNIISGDLARLPVVRCYDAVYDPDSRRYHILLEDLSTSHVAVPGTLLLS